MKTMDTFRLELRDDLLRVRLPADLQPEAARLAGAALQATTPADLTALHEGLSHLAHDHGAKVKAGMRLDLLRLADRCRMAAAQLDFLDRWAEVEA